jgi:hypothetical protein
MMHLSRRGRGYGGQSVPIAGLVAVLAVLLFGSMTACGRAAPAAATHEAHESTAAAAAPQGAAAAAPASVADTALRLQSLMGEHSVLAMDMMRARIRGDDDLTQVANSALTKNADGMTEIVRSVLDEASANKFRTLWVGHLTVLFNYARGLADNQPAVRDASRNTFLSFENSLADFFAAASIGRLSHDAAQAAVAMHITHLLGQADAYAAHDYATANRIYRQASAHTFDVGGVLAANLVPPDQSGALATPSYKLRASLAKLLGEHVALIVDATRSGVINSPDFATFGAALNGNTQDMTAAVSSLFGASAAASFQSVWADHVDQIMAYTAAIAAHDDKRKTAAQEQLKGFESRLSAFLESATGRRLASADFAKALASHDAMLMADADAYLAKDYQKAHDIADSTYDQMTQLASQLADAFGATVAAQAPKGGAETGQGGMAGVVGRR